MGLLNFILSGFIVLCGVFCFFGAWRNWEWFMNDSKARIFVWLFGYNGARVFYGVAGVAIIGIGVAMALGLIGSSPTEP